jgi:hypothetical protein
MAEWYPNHEHMNMDKSARRCAVTALDNLIADASMLRQRLLGGQARSVSSDDAASLRTEADRVRVHLAVAGTLREVRAWELADRADAVRRLCGRPKLALAMAEALGLEQDMAIPASEARFADLVQRVITAMNQEPEQ